MEKQFVFGYPGNATVTTTEFGITIARKGVLNAITKGVTGAKHIPFSSLAAVQFKVATGFTNGYIQFSVLGGRERLGGFYAATQDENSIVFMRQDAAKALELKDLVERGIRTAHSTPAVPTNDSPAAQVKEHKELLDLGATSAAAIPLDAAAPARRGSISRPLESYDVAYKGGLRALPKSKAGKIKMDLYPERIELLPTIGSQFWTELSPEFQVGG